MPAIAPVAANGPARAPEGDEPAVSGRLVAADRRRLLAWYEPRRSAYPWRSDPPDAYRVLVSEVMLQQTQAPRVAPIFEAFVARFPDVPSLARARRSDVITAWAGLGYHRRAVALHEAACAMMTRHGAAVPADVDALQGLPGVGPYTASAVASIAFGERRAAVDTNVRRITARYLFGAEPDEVPSRKLATAADRWVHPTRAGDWNQALMDVGRAACRPHPRCGACPLRGCRFRASGRRGRATVARQTAFEGSLRQLRGRVLAALLAGRPVAASSLAAELGEPTDRIEAAVDGLVRDGLAVRSPDGHLRLPG